MTWHVVCEGGGEGGELGEGEKGEKENGTAPCLIFFSSFRDEVPRGTGSVRGCCFSLPQEASPVWWHGGHGGGGVAPPLLLRSHIRQNWKSTLCIQKYTKEISPTDNEFSSFVESFGIAVAHYGTTTGSLFRGSELLCCLKYQVGMCVIPQEETDARL